MAAKMQRSQLDIGNCWLFAISSKADLARRLSTDGLRVSTEDLDRLARDAGTFEIFSIPKRDLQRLHTRIHRLLSRVQVPEYLHSAVKGKSYLSNARAHDRVVPTIKIDVKKFFPSVPRRAVFRFFGETMRCRRDVAGLLADFLTFDARLPTGSSASPIIAFYAFKPMFDSLAALAARHDLKMTCYVDDITMSGTKATKAILYEAHQIIAKFGLKSHKMKFFPRNAPKIITGVCNTPAGERVPNRLHLKIKVGFDNLRNAGHGKEARKILGPLLGRLEAARQIDPAFGARAKTLRAQMKPRRA
jgi:RNA-directed DNA polymerase